VAAKKKKKEQRSRVSRPDGDMAPDDTTPASPRVHEAFGILTLASALLVGPSMATVQFGDGALMGPFGRAVGGALNYVLGVAGYLVVAGIVVVALRIFAGGLGLEGQGAGRTSLWRERFGVVLGLLSSAMLLHLAARPQRVAGASLGGFVGEMGAEVLCALVSTVGAWLIGLSAMALSLVLATSFSWARLGLSVVRMIGAMSRALWEGLVDGMRGTREGLNVLGDGVMAFVASRRQAAAETRVNGGGVATLPPIMRLDLTRDEPGLVEDVEDVEDLLEEAPPPLDPHAMPLDLESEVPAPENKKTSAPVQKKEEGLTIVEAHFDQETRAEPEPEAVEVASAEDRGFVLTGDTYRPPPLSLLEVKESAGPVLDKEAIYEQAERLVRTLSDFKIEGRVTEVHPGPVVTMYEFVPVRGTRISKVANLADDLAMALHAQRVRIVAPIPGKGAIGIEVPNVHRETVFFKEIVGHKAFRKSKAKLPLALGKNIFGAPTVLDLAKMPHLLVAGATGAGKSVSVNSMICSLLMNHTPEEVRLIMVGPKFLELSGYNGIPHLMLPVVTDPKKANIALHWTVNEMERRYQMLADMRVRDIASFNRKVSKQRGALEAEMVELDDAGPGQGGKSRLDEARPSAVTVVRRNADGTEVPIPGFEEPEANAEETNAPRPVLSKAEVQARAERRAAWRKARRKLGDLPDRLPYIVVIIDEFADLMMVASKEVETSVARLAQKARAAGIHVILATQRPSVDVITGLIKANFPSRVSFQVASGHDSKTILGTHGAEHLLGNGDMLVLDRGTEMKRLHGAYISDDEIQRVVDWLKEQGKPIYDMNILTPPEEDEEGDATRQEEHDPMYDQAVALVAETRQASISMIQRRLRVGYNRAARMVETMEREGIVGPQEGVKGREVLIQHHEA